MDLSMTRTRKSEPVADDLFVANETVTAEIDGQPVTLRKDRARVRTGHPLLQDHSAKFAPVVEPGRGAGATVVAARRFGLFEYAGVFSLAGGWGDGHTPLTITRVGDAGTRDVSHDVHLGDRYPASAPVARHFPEMFTPAPPAEREHDLYPEIREAARTKIKRGAQRHG